jgi:hypothetical protein
MCLMLELIYNCFYLFLHKLLAQKKMELALNTHLSKELFFDVIMV